MSEKRPETTADIVSRSTPVSRDQLSGTRRGRYSVDLSSHMAECDANYHKLLRLFPQLREQSELNIGLPLINVSLPGGAVQASSGSCSEKGSEKSSEKGSDQGSNKGPGVAFEVVEKGPYTTLLRVSVRSEGRWLTLAAAPDMTIRVYHDAQSAEVVSYNNHNRFHGVYEYPNSRMRQRDEKVQLNRFLGEFLAVCLEHGVLDEPVSF